MSDGVDVSKKVVREDVPVVDLELDGSTQARVKTLPQVISDYSRVLDLEGWVFPPVEVFRDSKGRSWVADGFHRTLAAVAAGLELVPANVREGGVKDALRFALGANDSHGVRRTSDDIRRAVELACYEWPDYSDRAVAAVVRCSHPTVAKYRPVETVGGDKMGQDGKVYSEEGRGKINEGRCDDVERDDVGSVKQDVAVVDAGEVSEKVVSDVLAYDVAYVELDGRPGIAEVECWVEVVPTWRELSEGSEVPVVRMDNECGLPSNMIKRELVISWCKSSGSVTGDEPRWDGFRQRPVSLEHAERERARWVKQSRLGDEVVWLREFRELLLSRWGDAVSEQLFCVLARQSLRHAATEAVSLVARSYDEEVDVFSERVRAGDAGLMEAFGLLLGTELHHRGHGELEGGVLVDLLDGMEV